MSSLDYEREKIAFQQFYGSSIDRLRATSASLQVLIRSLLATDVAIAGAKVEGRVKNCDECLSKFRRKYLTHLEKAGTPYTVRDHVTDLIGLRVVCLYEDDVERVRSLIAEEFEVVAVTDKTARMEETADAFGYKGLHLDLRLSASRRILREYAGSVEFPFELQIRTVVQDSWSVLDHKIKYKKSIPNGLKRRINTLAALFELADREFRAIRDETSELERSDASYDEIAEESPTDQPGRKNGGEIAPRRYALLSAFSLRRIAGHFFPSEGFEPHKIDGFTQQVLELKPDLSRGKFNFYLREAIAEIRRYKADFEARAEPSRLNPFTVMRHCLYVGDPGVFASLLTDRARESFDAWRAANAEKGEGDRQARTGQGGSQVTTTVVP